MHAFRYATPPQKNYPHYSIYLNHNRPSEAHPCGRVILQAALRLHGTTISLRQRRWHQSPTAKPITQLLAYFSHTVSAQKMIKLFFSLIGANQRYCKYFDLHT